MPLLVAHPVLNSMLACYEIDMIRRESRCIVLPYLPARLDPAIRRLGQLLRDPERFADRPESSKSSSSERQRIEAAAPC